LRQPHHQQGEEDAAGMKAPGEKQARDGRGEEGVGDERGAGRDQASVQQDRNRHETNAGREQGLHRSLVPALMGNVLQAQSVLRIVVFVLSPEVWAGVIDRAGSAGDVDFWRDGLLPRALENGLTFQPEHIA